MRPETVRGQRLHVVWGAALGLAIIVLHLVLGAAGWHTQPDKASLFLVLAMGLNAVAVILGLRASRGQSWARHLRAGALIGAIASVIVFTGTWLVTAVVFPDYFLEMAEGYRMAYQSQGMAPDVIEQTVAGLAATTPVRTAVEGVVGTLVVSVVVAAVAGIWLRRES